MDPAARFEPCYRHAERTTGVRCQRCRHPICPRCMVPADVGFHCPQCVYGWAAPLHDVRQWLGRGPRWYRRWRGTAVLVLVVIVLFYVFVPRH